MNLLLVSLLGLFSPASSLAQAPDAAPPSRATEQARAAEHAPPLAIDGAPISWNEFSQWLMPLQGLSNREEFILEQLLLREARRLDVSLDQGGMVAEIEDVIQERINSAFGGDQSLWEEELNRLEQTPEIFRAEKLNLARRTFLTNAILQRTRSISDEQVRDLWEQRHGLDGREMQVSLLFLKITPPPQPPGTTREENIARNEAAKEQALRSAADLRASFQNGTPFESLVREFSNDAPSRERGGKLLESFSLSRWPNAPVEGLRRLQVGQVLEPFYGDGGICLMRLDSVKPTTFASVAAALRDELQNAEADQVESQALWSNLRGNSRTEVHPEMIRVPTLEDPRLERPVLSIDGEPFTREAYATWLMARRGRPLMRTFAQHREVETRARAAGIEISQVEVEARVLEIVDRQIFEFFKGDREDWLAELAANGSSLDDYLQVARIRVRHNLLAETLILSDREITMEDVHRAWEERYGENGQSLDLRYILRRIPPPADGEALSDEERRQYLADQGKIILEFLNQLRERAMNGEDFGALARTYSEESDSRDRGGRRQERIQLHTWPESIQKRLKALQVGEVAEPVEFGGGVFLLVELAGKVEVPLKEVAEALRAELDAQRPTQVNVSSEINSWTMGIHVQALPGMYQQN